MNPVADPAASADLPVDQNGSCFFPIPLPNSVKDSFSDLGEDEVAAQEHGVFAGNVEVLLLRDAGERVGPSILGILGRGRVFAEGRSLRTAQARFPVLL